MLTAFARPLGPSRHASPPVRLVEALHETPGRRCRDAATAFLRGTASGWAKRDLAQWLVCHYASVVVPSGDHGPRRRTAPVSVDEAAIERLVLDARTRAIRALRILTAPDVARHLARAVIVRGDAIATREAHGIITYAAVDRPHATLTDRVISLFVADWSNDRRSYRAVHHCGECGAASFGVALDHHATCTDYDRRHTVTFSGGLAIFRPRTGRDPSTG